MAKAQQQELDFQNDGSSASSSQRRVRGAGRRANLQRNLNIAINQPPPTRKKTPAEHVRNDEAVGGFTRKLIRGVSGLLGH